MRAVEALHAGWQWPAEVELVDGGTQGLALLPIVQAASHLLILDAIDAGLAPGELAVFADDAVPAYLTAKNEPAPNRLCRGAGAGRVVWPVAGPAGAGGRAAGGAGRLRRQPDRAGARAVAAGAGARAGHSGRLGAYPPRARRRPPTACIDASLALLPYEAGRPSAEAACRVAMRACWRKGGLDKAMCGCAMQVLRLESPFAVWCRDASGGEALIDIGLIAAPQPGDWLLTFRRGARGDRRTNRRADSVRAGGGGRRAGRRTRSGRALCRFDQPRTAIARIFTAAKESAA